jgi:hypothetical protein
MPSVNATAHQVRNNISARPIVLLPSKGVMCKVFLNYTLGYLGYSNKALSLFRDRWLSSVWIA